MKIIVSKLILENGLSQNDSNYESNSKLIELHFAAMENLTEIGELLISKGRDINARDIIYLNIIILFLIKII